MNISVIIPVYNVERYVERCLLSIINQTYTESVECIVVNDCTPDNSMKIVEKLVADYKGSIQFKLLCHKHNRGLAAVRNTGINNAGGKYIVHVDSDDYCEPDMLEKMYIKALETDADIVLADMWRTYPDHEEYCSRQIVSLDKIERLRGCLVGRYGAIIDKMIKRSLYVNNKIQCIEGVNYGEDSLAVLSLFYYANTIVNIPSAFMHYVQYNTASYTKSLSRTSLDNMVEVGERKIALLRQWGMQEALATEIRTIRINIWFQLMLCSTGKLQKEWNALFCDIPLRAIWGIPYVEFSAYWKLALSFASMNMLVFYNLLRNIRFSLKKEKAIVFDK